MLPEPAGGAGGLDLAQSPPIVHRTVVLQVPAVSAWRIRSTSALSVSMVPGSRLEGMGRRSSAMGGMAVTRLGVCPRVRQAGFAPVTTPGTLGQVLDRFGAGLVESTRGGVVLVAGVERPARPMVW